MDPRLEEACHTGNLSMFHSLLQEDKLLLHRFSSSITASIDNPLHIAASLGHTDLANEIIIKNPDLSSVLNPRALSALHLASAHGHLEIVKLLISKVGTHLCFLKGRDGRLAIHIAAMKGRIDILEELIKLCPESARALTYQHESILHIAVQFSSFKTVDFLVKKLEVDDDINELFNLKDDKGNTILHHAVARKQLKSVKLLLRKGEVVEVNAMNHKGLTALDVLLVSPIEHGDLTLGEVIRAAGGKKASEMDPQQTSLQTNTSRNESSGTVLDVPLDSPIEHGEVIRTAGGEIEITSRNESSGTVLDVPLVSPIEHGEVIRTAGGEMDPQPTSLQTNTSRNGSSGTTPPSRSRRRTRLQRSTPGEVEDNLTPDTLMIVASLIATITFQCGLNPPGGFIQDNARNVGAPSGPPTDAGLAVLGSDLSLFWLFNMIGLLASFSIILILICVAPRKKKILVVIMSVAVISTSLAFCAAMYHIYPYTAQKDNYIGRLWWFFILTLTFGSSLILAIFLAWVVLSVIVYLLRNVGWWRKKEGDKVSKIVRNGGYLLRCMRIGVVLTILLLLGFLVLYSWGWVELLRFCLSW